MELITRSLLTSDSGSGVWTISNIPNTYTDLLIYSSLRTNRASTLDRYQLYFNGTTSNRTYRDVMGFGDTATSLYSEGGASALSLYSATAADATANTFSNTRIYIPNYTVAKNKTLRIEGTNETNGTNSWIETVIADWNDTAAINSFTLSLDFGNSFIAGSSVTVYGITAGSDGTTTVS